MEEQTQKKKYAQDVPVPKFIEIVNGSSSYAEVAWKSGLKITTCRVKASKLRAGGIALKRYRKSKKEALPF